ncbi:thioredoxin family protein [Risungbinella massiliensis]|uniref:thioredoxin family protein n=1 Tax=Risungbinella massiliensis TaxID=1329796 RepID=UPI0005CBF187|nr:thioredoxin family protein [Risungbinella massiliensis]
MNKLTQQDFQNFIESGKKVVEFSASWCIDCKRIAPDLPEIEGQFQGKFDFAELDVDDAREVAEKYNVKGIPTFIVFQDGKEVDRLPSRDAKTKEQVVDFLEQQA